MQTTKALSVEALAPHNIEAEQVVLGSLLINNDINDAIVGLIEEDCFFDPVHREIYSRIISRINAGQLASPITLRTDLENYEPLKAIGGSGYLARMAGVNVSANFIKDYALILSDLKAKREILDQCRNSTDKIRDGKEGAAAIAMELETGVGIIAAATTTKPITRSYLSTMMGAITQINDAYQGITPAGVSTGLPQLDAKLGYMRAGNFILLAGRPAMGKTTVAQNIAFHAATNGTAVFIASLEMMGEELTVRFISKGLATQGINIPYNKLIKGDLTEFQMRQVVDESRRQEFIPIEIAERDVRDINKLRSAIRRAFQKFSGTTTPLGLVIIDYVQQLHSPKARSIYERVGDASDFCKSIAMEFAIPVIGLAQLSREVEKRDPPVPMLADLRESGKLEEDADAVLFCYRDEYYLQQKLDGLNGANLDLENEYRIALDRCRNGLQIIVGKQRSGPTGTVSAYMDAGCCHVTQDRSGQAGHLI